MKKNSLLLIAFLFAPFLFAQEWINKMNTTTTNFYEVKKSFTKYWKKETRKQKLKSFFIGAKEDEEGSENYLLYKRWEEYIAPRVGTNGDRNVIENGSRELAKLIANPSQRSLMQAGGNWFPLGSFDVPNGGGGAGRLNCVRFHPTNPSIIYVGAAAGGLWKSTNNGVSWTTATDRLPSLGVSDVAVVPTNTNIMYLATGDIDAGDTYSVGVLKSIDGGVTWSITGFSSSTNQSRRIARILIHPNNPNILYVGASNGIYKSTDAGVTWQRVLGSGVKDLEFKPGDPSIIYAAASNAFYKSINGGNSFNAVSAGLPPSVQVSRIAIAVTPANPNYVYLLYSSANSNGFAGLYRSTTSGSSFTLQANSPNLLGWDENGNDSGGQGWYTLSVAASPTNAEEVIVGGVNIWRSSNGGVDWNLDAHWYGGGGAPYVHADIHDLIYRPTTSTVFAACDGGIFKSTNGNGWQDLSNGLQIGQMYRMGNATTNSNLVVQGWQDNGTNRYSNSNWDHILGGDGMDCFIDWSNASYIYGSIQNGSLHRSSDGGASFTFIAGDITEDGEWITPWCQDPINSQTIYAGFKNVWKSSNRGNSWTQLGTINTGGLKILKVAKSNPQYIYASEGGRIYKTNDGGFNWTNFSIPNAFGTYKDIAIHTTNPNIFWVVLSGYSAGSKVFKTTDGGATWTNISFNLPNIPANCVEYQSGTNDGIYVGTDLGVYYIDNTMNSWLPYSNGLPNVIIDDLEIHYGSSKLRAASYGRGLWETSIYNPLSNEPYANFTADSLMGCPGLTVQFTDLSLNNPTTWNWTFSNGTPSTSTLQNPIVTFNSAGTYNDIKLIVTNANGIDSVIKYSYISISPQITPVIELLGTNTICSGTSVQMRSSNSNTYLWSPNGQTSFQINANTSGVFYVTTKDIYGCTTTSAPVSVFVVPPPVTPTVTIVGDTLYSSAPTGNQWYINNVLVPGATQQQFVMTVLNAIYKVVVTDSITGCSAASGVLLGIQNFDDNTVQLSAFPNPAKANTLLTFNSEENNKTTIKLMDELGKVVYEKNFNAVKGQNELIVETSIYEVGLYFLSVSQSNGNAVIKLIIEK